MVDTTRERERDLAKITVVLDAIVAEFGYDYVYPHAARGEESGQCMYVENKDPERFKEVYDVDHDQLMPSCIIGQLAVRLGVEIDALLNVNEEAYTETCTFIFIPHTRFFRKELAALQERQDTGMSWGEAVDKFKQETGEKAA